MVSTHHREASDSESLCRVTLRHDECTLPRLCRTSLVRVIQLGDTSNLRLSGSISLLEFLHLLELRECCKFIGDARLQNILHKVFGWFKLRTKVLSLRGTLRLHLTREGWVFQSCLDEDGKSILHLLRLQLNLLRHILDDTVGDVIRDMVDVSATLHSTETIHE